MNARDEIMDHYRKATEAKGEIKQAKQLDSAGYAYLYARNVLKGKDDE